MRRSRSFRGHAKAALVVALLATTFGPGRATVGSVVILRGGELTQYRAVEKGFVAALGQPARTVQIGSDRAQARAAGSGADVVFAIGPEAAAVAADLRPATVYALVPSPERLGLDPKNAVPTFVPAHRQIRFVRAALPSARKVGIVYDPALSRALAAEYEEAAATQGFGVVREEVSSRREVAGVVRSLVDRVDVLWLLPDSTVISPETFRFMMQISLESRVPVVGFSEGMTRGGALLSVEGGFEDMGRRGALAVRRVLAGRPAAPEPPDGSLFMNARSAELLGVSIPPRLRSQATKIFD